MALGSTQPLTKMSTRNLPGGKGRPGRKTDNLTAICELIVWKMWEPRRLTTLCAFTACYRDSFISFPRVCFLFIRVRKFCLSVKLHNNKRYRLVCNPCIWVEVGRSFAETCYILLQGKRLRQVLIAACFLLCSFFVPEDRGSIAFSKLLPEYTASHWRRQCTSYSPLWEHQMEHDNGISGVKCH
jgi:hypothetical protein